MQEELGLSEGTITYCRNNQGCQKEKLLNAGTTGVVPRVVLPCQGEQLLIGGTTRAVGASEGTITSWRNNKVCQIEKSLNGGATRAVTGNKYFVEEQLEMSEGTLILKRNN